jgi:hypothetical protein
LAKRRWKFKEQRRECENETRECIEYVLLITLLDNPRITVRELSRIIASLRNWKLRGSAQRIVDRLFTNEILVGPYLYCNSGMKVTLFQKKDMEKGEVDKGDFSITLAGNYSSLQVSQNGKETVLYAELVKPSFPEKVALEGSIADNERAYFETWFRSPGRLKPDVIPDWDNKEWELYNAMRNPRQNFFDVGKKLQIPWKTVKERFQKIVRDCKVCMGFYPLGYSQYDPLLVTFKTRYETGMRKFLAGLDRSSWLFKVDDMLILYLFQTHINLTCLKFSEMNELRIIEDLRVGIPFDVDRDRFLII